MSGSLDMFPDAAIEYLIEHADEEPKPKPKPKIEGDTDQTRLSTWGGEWTKTIVHTRWIVSCPCHMNADYAIAVVPSWEAALEIVRVHLETRHA